MPHNESCRVPQCSVVSTMVVTSTSRYSTTVNVPFACIIVCAIWMTSIFANSLVCVVIRRSRRLQSTTNYFVTSLAMVDMALSVTCAPFMLADYVTDRWVFGEIICPLVILFQWIGAASTMFILSCICIDRFYTILYPLSFKVTRAGAKRMIVISFAAAILLSCPGLYFYKVMETVEGSQCLNTMGETWTGLAYISLYCVLTYFFPVLGMASGHCRVFRYIWQAGTAGRAFQRTMNPVPYSKVKMVKLIIIVSVAVSILLLPLYAVHLYACMNKELRLSSWLKASAFLTFYFSTVAKSLLYLLLNPNFRRGCREVFCMSALKCYRSNIYTVTTPSPLAKQNHIGTVEEGTETASLQMRCINSPSKTFDRAAVMRKIAWPMDGDNSTHL